MKKTCENCINAENLYSSKKPFVFCGMYEQPMQKSKTPMCYEAKEIVVVPPTIVKPIVQQINLNL